MTLSKDPAYLAWRGTPFPASATPSTDLNEWHKDLLVVDMWTADALVPLVKNGIYVPSVPDVLKEIARLHIELERLARLGLGDDLVLVPSYRRYLDLLNAAYRRFLEAAPA